MMGIYTAGRGRGRMCVMCEARMVVRVVHRVVYAWNCRSVARAQVWRVFDNGSCACCAEGVLGLGDRLAVSA